MSSDSSHSRKKKWLNKKDWIAQKKNTIRLKYPTPKQRARRISILEEHIEGHKVTIETYKAKYATRTRNAQFEISVLNETDA